MSTGLTRGMCWRSDSTRSIWRSHMDITVSDRPGSCRMRFSAAGRWNSAPPWIHGGNLDNKELVAGTTLYLPVWVKGALLEIGDGHAAQGNGEVDITAIETSLIGKLHLVVHKARHLSWPMAETPTHIITMGDDRDLN